MFVCGFARWLPVKQNNSMLVYNTVDHALGRVRERKPCTSKTEGWKLRANQISQADAKKPRHPDTSRTLREMISAAMLVQGKQKVTHLTLLTLKADFACHWRKKKKNEKQSVCGWMLAHTKQPADTMRTKNSESIVIRGPKTKASSGGCQSQTEAATTQLSVLRQGVTQSCRRLRKRETRGEERFRSGEPCSKIKPGDSEHSLTGALEKHSLHWWTEAFYAVLRGSEVQKPEHVADISTAIVGIVAVSCSRNTLWGDDKPNSSPATGPRHEPANRRAVARTKSIGHQIWPTRKLFLILSLTSKELLRALPLYDLKPTIYILLQAKPKRKSAMMLSQSVSVSCLQATFLLPQIRSLQCTFCPPDALWLMPHSSDWLHLNV